MKTPDPYSHRFQEIMLLLAAIHELEKARSKKEVLDFIESKFWIDLQIIDKRAYQSSSTGEPRWRNSIAFARKDCVDLDFLEPDNDVWIATVKGMNLLPRIRKFCRMGDYDITKCWFLSNEGKRFFDPNYAPSEKDTKRPNHYYRDQKPTAAELAAMLMD